MLYGYVRVSTKDQKTDRQKISLLEQFINLDEENIFIDKASGAGRAGTAFDRPEYKRLKAALQPGDEVAIHELDRFGRSKIEIMKEIEWFKDNNVILRILNIPTTLQDFPDGTKWVSDMVNNILFEVYCSLAEQEHALIVRRTKEGLEAAREKGRLSGRPKVDQKKIDTALEMYETGAFTTRHVCEVAGISKSVFYKYLNRKKAEQGEI